MVKTLNCVNVTTTNDLKRLNRWSDLSKFDGPAAHVYAANVGGGAVALGKTIPLALVWQDDADDGHGCHHDTAHLGVSKTKTIPCKTRA